MIATLTGKLKTKLNNQIVIDVNGVGYLVFCSERTLAEIATEGEFTTIYTDLLVREDLMQVIWVRLSD